MAGKARLRQLVDKLFERMAAYNAAIARQDDGVWKYFARSLSMLDAQAKREAAEARNLRAMTKAFAVQAFSSSFRSKAGPELKPVFDPPPSGHAGDAESNDQQSDPEPVAAPSPPKGPVKLQRQGGARNVFMADLVGVAAAHILVAQQPLASLTPEEAAAQRRRMFVWMLRWKRKDEAASAREATQAALKEVIQPCSRTLARVAVLPCVYLLCGAFISLWRARHQWDPF